MDSEPIINVFLILDSLVDLVLILVVVVINKTGMKFQRVATLSWIWK